MENRKKTARFKPFLATFVVLTIIILSLNLVAAFEFDNIKTYDKETKTIVIENSFLGIPLDKVAEIKLDSNLNVNVIRGKDRKIAEFTITTYEDYKEGAFDNLEFYRRSKSLIPLNKTFKYRYKYLEEVITVNDYKEVCSPYLDSKNNSMVDNCNKVLIGTHKENIYNWKAFNKNTDLKAGEVTLGIFIDVEAGERGEWIPTLFGVEIKEWAAWTESLNTDLELYYDFEDKEEQISGTYNLTNLEGTPTYVSDGNNLIGKHGSITAENNWEIQTGENRITDFVNSNVTFNVWVQAPSLANYKTIFDTYDGGSVPGKGWYTRFDTGSYWFTSWLSGDNNIGGLSANEWIMLTIRRQDSNMTYWVDGTLKDSGTVGAMATSSSNLRIGTRKTFVDDYVGYIDEFGVWNRSLTDTEIVSLYNEGSGIIYIAEFTDMTITQNEPADNYNTTNPTVTFNCTSTSSDGVIDLTLKIDGADNLTITNSTPLSNLSLQVDLTLTEGAHNWSCEANDDAGINKISSTRNLRIDSIAPSINIDTPINGTTILTADDPYNLTSTVTISDSYLDTCIFFNSTANTTVTCGLNSSVNLGAGTHTIGWYANDTNGNSEYITSTIYINQYSTAASYTEIALEQETYTFGLNISAIVLNSFNGTFYYNNTAQTTSYSDNGTLGVLTSSVQTNSLGNISFYWDYFIGDTELFYNSTHIVTEIENISVVGDTACPAGLSAALHYDFKDEQNSTELNNSIDYLFRYGISNNTLRTTAGSLEAQNMTLCINTTVWNDYSIGYGEIQYKPAGYSDRRYYTFSADRISNVTITNPLYSLIAGSSTSFLFTVQKGDLSVYDGVYLTLNRWYPEEDEYKVVEMGKTDDEGNTVMKVEIEDVDYRVGVYETDGTLIYLAAPFRLVCIASPCTYSLTVPEDAGNSFENWKDLQVSLDFDTTTSIFTMVYNDPSQDTSTIGLNVYRDTGMSELLICSDNASSYTGVLTCDVSGYTGLLRAIGFRTASPETSVISKTVQQATPKLGKTPALFLSVILMIFLVSVGVVSPILTVILSILAFIPALIFGVMPLPILLIIAAMGFIVIHFMKRSVN